MPWSTRQLADLAGTTVNTVRHYHRLGVLDEPGRSQNGYKHYEPFHLARLLHILRLRELGVPVSQIDDGMTGDGDEDAFDAIDADLAARIKHLRQVRTEIQTLRSSRADD